MPRLSPSSSAVVALGIVGTLLATSLVLVSSGAEATSSATSVVTPYTVEFSETGLPNGTNWSVHVAYTGCSCDGVYRTVKSNTSTISIPVTNGTYLYRVPLVPGYWVNASFRGTFDVLAANLTIPSFVFHPLVEFPVVVRETGLPAGTNWTVHVAGNGSGQLKILESQTRTTDSSTLNLSLPNGTFRYRVSPVNGSFFLNRSFAGGFVVAGVEPSPIGVQFVTPPVYTVSFQETGLAPGTNWSVRVVGWAGLWIRMTHASTSPNITFVLPNGAYRSILGGVLGYVVNGSVRSSFVVGGSAENISVQFRALSPGEFYPVAFQESGLANGTHWSVTVRLAGSFGFSSRETQSGNGTTIFFLLQNSSYRFLVHTPRGYNLTSGGSGSFSISGASPSVFLVTFKPIPTYTVTLTVSGLDNGTNWTGVLRTQSAGSTPWPIRLVEMTNATTLTFSVPNGTYCYAFLAVTGYTVSSGMAQGSITVAGASPPTVSVVFTLKG